MTIQPHYSGFEGIGHYSTTLSASDAIEIALAYNCSPKAETLLEFVNDNVWAMQTILYEHKTQIEKLENNKKGKKLYYSVYFVCYSKELMS